jgi:hypothetical protein
MRLLLDWVSMLETSSTHDHVAVIYSIRILILVFFKFFYMFDICLIQNIFYKKYIYCYYLFYY